jgi:hypothetical protein
MYQCVNVGTYGTPKGEIKFHRWYEDTHSTGTVI